MRMDLNDNPKKHGIGFLDAVNGIIQVIHSERNFRIHLYATILVVILSVCLKLSIVEWAIILLVIALVLITEMINTVVEEMMDYLNPTIHEKAGKIKDIAAGVVLISAVFAVIIGTIIYLPKIYHLF